MNSETVAQDMFTVLHGQPAPVVTRWTYSTADPFAVTLGIRGRGDQILRRNCRRAIGQLKGNRLAKNMPRFEAGFARE